MKGLALADPAFAQAVGREFALKMRGSASSSGEATFDAIDLSTPNFDAHYSGLLGRSKIHGKANIVARDLSRFALLAGGALKGEARIAADLDGSAALRRLERNRRRARLEACDQLSHV